MTAALTQEPPSEESIHSQLEPELPPFDPEDVARYLREGRPLKELIGLGDNVWETMYDFGYRNFKNGQFAMAEFWWMHTCLFDSDLDRNWIALGVACKRQQKYEAAINAFALAVHNGSTNPWAPLHAAECLLQQGKTAWATQALDSADKWAGNSDEEEIIRKRIAMLRRGLERRQRAKDSGSKTKFVEPVNATAD